MTEKEMQDYLEMFASDDIEPIFSFWDEQTEDKRLICASHDHALVLEFIIGCPLATESDKIMARALLASLMAEERKAEAMAMLGESCDDSWFLDIDQA
jgi:hypothetical protein